MTEASALETRIDALETRVAHQDSVIEDLNETITAQWSAIDKLTRQMAYLDGRLKEAEAHVDATAPPEPPPPHY